MKPHLITAINDEMIIKSLTKDHKGYTMKSNFLAIILTIVSWSNIVSVTDAGEGNRIPILIDNFEGNTFESWKWVVGDARVVIDSSEAKEGKRSLKIDFGPKGDGIVQNISISQVVKSLTGFEKIQFWAKCDGSDRGYKVFLRQGNKSFWTKQTFSCLDTQWHKVVIDKTDFELCPWIKDSAGVLLAPMITHLYFRDDGKKSEIGHTIYVDNINLIISNGEQIIPVSTSTSSHNVVPSKKSVPFVAHWKSDDGNKPLIVHADGTRKISVLNGVWDFQLIEKADELDCTKKIDVAKNDGVWSKIKVPSAWDNSHENQYPKEWANFHQAWYRRMIKIPNDYIGKRIHIRFSAVALHAQVFLNGKWIGEHWGSWTPFELDATKWAKIGDENIITVFVADLKCAIRGKYDQSVIDSKWGWIDFPKIQGTMIDWTLGECPLRRGIWQDVFLVGVDPVYSRDAHIITSVNDKTLKLSFDLINEDINNHDCTIDPYIVEAVKDENVSSWNYEATVPGSEIQLQLDSTTIKLMAGEKRTITLNAKWKNPRLWEPADPFLYYVMINTKAGNICDLARTRFGFREVRICGSELLLNNIPTRLLGVTAVKGNYLSGNHNRMVWEVILNKYKKDLNMSGVRLMSEVPYPIIPTICDEIGMMVIEQSSNWASPGFHYANLRAGDAFRKNVDSEFTEWIKRDRNHPSILVWCPQNEGSDDNEFMPLLKELKRIVIKNDDSRPIEFDGISPFGGRRNDEPLSDTSAIHYGWEYAGKKNTKGLDVPVGCVEQINKVLTVGDSKYQKDQGFIDEKYREILYSLSYQRIKRFYAVLVFDFISLDILETVFPIDQEVPLQWDNKIELYPKPDHTSKWCSTAVVDLTDISSPRVKLNSVCREAMRTAFNPLFFGNAESVHDYSSGQKVEIVSAVINDTRKPANVKLKVNLGYSQQTINILSSKAILVPGEIRELPIIFTVPSVDKYEVARLQYQITDENDNIIFNHEYPLDIYPEFAIGRQKVTNQLFVYDPVGTTSEIFKNHAISCTLISDLNNLPIPSGLIIGKNVKSSDVNMYSEQLRKYIQKGGNVLILERGEGIMEWIPVRIPIYYPPAQRAKSEIKMPAIEMAAIDAPTHPIFNGILDNRLFHWRNGNKGTVAECGLFRPIQYSASGNMRSLVSADDYGKISLMMEIAYGKGCIIMSQLELINNADINPVASRILGNAIKYIADRDNASHTKAVFIGNDICEIAKDRGFDGELAVEYANKLNANNVMFIGPQACDDLPKNGDQLKAYIQNGGTIICSSSEKETDFSSIVGNLITKENKITHRRLQSSGIGYKWCSRYTPQMPIIRRGRLLESIMSCDLTPDRGEFHHAFEFTGTSYMSEIELLRPMFIDLQIGKGRFVATTLPILTSETYRSKLIYHTIMTNLGIRFNHIEQKINNDDRKNVPSYAIIHAGQVTIDGDLQEWTFEKGENGIIMDWRKANSIVVTSKDICDIQVDKTSGNRDKSAVAYLMWDENALYFAAKVIDDVIYDKGGEWNGDAIELCIGKTKFTIDIKGDSFSIVGGDSDGIRIPKEKILYAMKKDNTLGGTRGTEILLQAGGDSVDGAPGYSIEMSIPIEYLPMLIPVKTGRKIAFSIAFDDNDGNGRKSQIAWPKTWKWNDVTTWGVAELVQGK